MRSLEIARKLAELGQKEDAVRAYTLFLGEANDKYPEEQLEAAMYILSAGGNYKISYTCLRNLFNKGYYRKECLAIMDKAFYQPNLKVQKTRYQNNCKRLLKYPYIFCKDFLAFEDLPIQFYPYDDESYTPYDSASGIFGEYINFNYEVISRNFFKELDKPVLASNVYSQYELEYLVDNVRKSEWIGRENHIYLHYTDWETFCSHLQVLDMRRILEEKKVVFLIGDEIGQYPIDFKERFGIDYSQYPVKPISIREIHRLIWHTQLAAHNGGDFFNEIFDNHPNLICQPSLMMTEIENAVESVRKSVERRDSSPAKLNGIAVPAELYRLKNVTEKDILVGTFIALAIWGGAKNMDSSERVSPALFVQPHFPIIRYSLVVDDKGRTQLASKEYEEIRELPMFRAFKYIKAFTPMRRMTNSMGAMVKFMYNRTFEDSPEGKVRIVEDPVMNRILNRSFMADPSDRLYRDSIIVRFEDGKLNPKATFTALAAFLDLPYTESMTYCSLNGERDPESLAGNDIGFSPAAIYRDYSAYVGAPECRYLEYFMRDAYQYYGYDFQYYDGSPVDEEMVDKWVDSFGTVNHYIEESWRRAFARAQIIKNGVQVDKETADEARDVMAAHKAKKADHERRKNAKILLRDLRFVNRRGQPLHMTPLLQLDPELLEQPLYR